LTAAILGHACEEGRHALGLKKLAVKLGGAEFDSYAPEAVLCGEEAEAYSRTSTKLATRPSRVAPRPSVENLCDMARRTPRARRQSDLQKSARGSRKSRESSAACLQRRPSTSPMSKLCFMPATRNFRRARRNFRRSKPRSIRDSSAHCPASRGPRFCLNDAGGLFRCVHPRPTLSSFRG
jgi:hypothetical protein